MPEKLANILPFMLAVGATPPQLSYKRIIEGLIISVVAGVASGFVAMYVTQAILTVKIEAVETQVVELKMELRQIKRDIYRPHIGGPSLPPEWGTTP